MKKLSSTIIFITLFVFNQSTFAQSNKAAVDYMNQFSQSFNELKGETWQYLKSITSGKNSRTVDAKRQNLLNKTNLVKAEVSKKGDFNNDASLRNAVVDYLNLSYTVLKEDYDKILNMEEIAEQSYDNMEAYLLAREKANDALKYYNIIYLIHFKCYKQEMYTLDAISRSDVNGLQQNINTLLNFSNQELEKIKTVGSYSGDGSLLAVAKQFLTFYKQEASKDFPGMIDFFIKKDNFEKIQKTFEAKSKNARTKQDVDQYNKASSEYNLAVAAYNKINNSTNLQRTNLYELWNQKINLFFKNHAE